MKCPAYLSCLDLRFLIMLGEEYNAYSSALCNFLHSPVISFLLAPNIFLSTLFSNTLNLCSSLNVRDQVSQAYNTVPRCGASGSMRACHAAGPDSIPGRDKFPG